mmetsp:Transcript_97334/g.223040  ORF Transcript_97334/g.223040 Transcript_97334/m.223040 type:complete len:466 (-) Transcript_97334:41-1438(-)
MRQLWAWALLVGSSSASEEGPAFRGSHAFCKHGQKHVVVYDTVLDGPAERIVQIDSLQGLSAAQCDNDASALRLTFKDTLHAAYYLIKFNMGHQYLTGGSDHGCKLTMTREREESDEVFLLRRVFAAVQRGSSLYLETARAKYDEIFKFATIKYGAFHHDDCVLETAAESWDSRACVGLNTNGTCTQADQSIPVYNTPHSNVVNVTCDSCFVGLKANFFFNIQIANRKLVGFQGGFTNGTVHGGMSLMTTVSRPWNVGVDKTMPIADDASNPIVQFNIGPVPFVFWFELQYEIFGGLTLDAAASAAVGANIRHHIGDCWIKWDPQNRWQHSTIDPSTELTPAIRGTGSSFYGNTNVSVTYSILFFVNHLFSYSFNFQPGFNLGFTGDSELKRLCQTGSYAVNFYTESTLYLNYPWNVIPATVTWGPRNLWRLDHTLLEGCAQLGPPAPAPQAVTGASTGEHTVAV